MTRAAFLDRDGVLVETFVRDGQPYAATTLEEFEIVADAAEQVGRLRKAGLVCLVFTNQPEVARGAISPETLEAMHTLLREWTAVDGIYVCPHDNDDACDCRKPNPGMLRSAAKDWQVDLGRSFVIGDRWRDVDAGRAVGCYTVLLDRPYSACPQADSRVRSLGEAVDVVLKAMEAR